MYIFMDEIQLSDAAAASYWLVDRCHVTDPSCYCLVNLKTPEFPVNWFFSYNNNNNNNNRFTAFYPGLYTRVSRYQKKHITYAHLSWSSTIRYQLLPSTATHSIIPVQFTCSTVLCTTSLQVFYGLSLGLEPSTLYISSHMTADTNHSWTPFLHIAHLITSLGTLSKAFSKSTKPKELLSFNSKILLYLSYNKNGISSSLTFYKSNLRVI